MQSSARYIGPDTAAIERHWQVDRDNAWRGGELFPRSPGVLIRAARYSAELERALRVGQWGLVKEARLGYSTVNTRFEEITSNPSYKDPWRYGKRWIIPAWGAWRTELGVKLQRHQFVVIKSCVPAEQNRNDGPTDLFEVGQPNRFAEWTKSPSFRT